MRRWKSSNAQHLYYFKLDIVDKAIVSKNRSAFTISVQKRCYPQGEHLFCSTMIHLNVLQSPVPIASPISFCRGSSGKLAQIPINPRT